MDNRVQQIMHGVLVLAIAGLLTGVPASALNIMVFEQSDRTAPVPLALIYSDGEYSATTDENGTYNLSYEGDPPLLRIAKAGYRDWIGTPAVNDTLLLVPLQIRNCTYSIQVFDADSLLPVEGAQVRTGYGADTVRQGHTDANGTVTLPLRSEQVYDLTITMRNYQPVRDKLVTGFENIDIQYSLIRNDRISVLVKDAQGGQVISDAVIFADGQESGKTNEKGILTTNLSRGIDHTLEVVAPGYEKTVLQKKPEDEDLIFDINLIRLKSPVFVSVYDTGKQPVEGAAVWIDGNEIGMTNQYGRFMVPDLELREYEFLVFKEGYESRKRSQLITSESSDIIFEISPVKVEMMVRVQDPSGHAIPNATVQLDNVSILHADINGSVGFILEQGRSYLVSANMDGYRGNNTTISASDLTPVVLVLTPQESPMVDAPFPWLTIGVILALVLAGVILILYYRGGGKRPSSYSRQKRNSLRKRSL
ncbi:MAG: carboxypeptidase regulatory-like domain-containing protein [Methanobacteriota archaeon]